MVWDTDGGTTYEIPEHSKASHPMLSHVIHERPDNDTGALLCQHS